VEKWTNVLYVKIVVVNLYSPNEIKSFSETKDGVSLYGAKNVVSNEKSMLRSEKIPIDTSFC
jgi:hypothetical protein